MNIQTLNSFKLRTLKPFQNQTIFTATLPDHTEGGEQPLNTADADALFTKARTMPLPGRFHAR